MTQDEWRSVKATLPNGPTGHLTLALWFADVALLAAAWVLWLAGGPGRIAALVLATLALIHLYLIMHEALHNAASRTRACNEAIGHLCGWIIGLPYLPRRRTHLGHHAWTAHPTRDPENRKMIQKFSVMTERGARTLEFIWRHWIPMMAFNHFLSHWIAPFLQRDTPAHRAKSNTEIAFSAIYLAGYAAVGALAYRAGVLGSLIAFSTILWIVLLMAVELLNLPHHAEIPLLADDAARPPLWEQDVVSHSCANVPLWSRWVILNFNLHVAHHAYPWLPWYDLPRAQRLLDAVSTAEAPRQTHEWAFAVTKRRRPLLELMGHFFDKRGASSQGGR
ncbi:MULTISPECIES: fatty acid desaturase [unclassified Burkholderia]|uniref:fatty acid desaturase family protein n=1 Tax=unclassified Burkholderia TaxID=2613784 RepID=UPI000B79FCFF|nr:MULTISPECIES: fatty acid desaturase [unclassified Burkholderia]NIE55265.1 fatty acid desaturase [Burkholderia sp. Ap-955]NIF08168.1 fatty acid desaturase [Burkholderia sp. Ax-1735]NIG01195.1 fatty acid desaturase [Burkholderia sp. Tr-849]OXJ25541.1 fatty acid desaturase [Burkholderia sp. HI2714]